MIHDTSLLVNFGIQAMVLVRGMQFCMVGARVVRPCTVESGMGCAGAVQ